MGGTKTDIVVSKCIILFNSFTGEFNELVTLHECLCSGVANNNLLMK